MITVGGRINGQHKPKAELQLDTLGDAVAARRALVDHASAELNVPVGVPHDDVAIYLKGGEVFAARDAVGQ